MNSGNAILLGRSRQRGILAFAATIGIAAVSGAMGCGKDAPATPGGGSGGMVGTGGSGGIVGTGGITGTGGVTGTGGAAGGGGADAVTLTDAEWAKVRTLSPLPATPPADTTNGVADNAMAATLGQRLFFERGFSGALAVGDDGTNGGLGPMGAVGRIACASCHAGPALADDRSQPGTVSLGADFLPRNAPPLVNSSYYKWTNWAGRFSAQWELPIAVLENAKNMNGDRLRLAHVIFNKYRTDYEAVFNTTMEPGIGSDATRFPPSAKPKAAGAVDGPWEAMAAADQTTINVILANFGKVLEAYTRKLIGGPSPFDRFVAGETTAMSASEVRGLKLFVAPGSCASCHTGPMLSDDQFHNLGLAQSGAHVPAADNGRFADITPLLASGFNTLGVYSDDKTTGRLEGLMQPPPDTTKGQFRTASLRNVALTAPYMHAGQLSTLVEVVDYYNQATPPVPTVGTLDPLWVNLHLTPGQKADLVAFLGSLTGTAVAPALLADTSAP